MLAAKSGVILRSSYSWERANGNIDTCESGTADLTGRASYSTVREIQEIGTNLTGTP